MKSLPGIVPDGKRIVTSDDVLRMDTLPASVIVIGAGAVGVEFASMYHDLGSTVTVLEYLPAIVPLEDRDVSKELERSFSRRGIKVITNARFDAKSVKVEADCVKLTVGPEGKDASEIEAEILLVAAGRATNVEDVGLETTSAEVDRGIVKVDGHMRTKEPHLYAIGDIVGGLMLAHTAAHEGITAAHTIAGDPDVHPMDYVMQPRATYCRPEIASVGLTEQQCEERGLPIKVAKVPFQAIAKAIIGGEYEGFAKIIGNKETEDTLGHPHHRPARDRPHRRGVARPLPRRDAVGDRRLHPRAPDAQRDPRRDRDGGRRTVDQLLAGLGPRRLTPGRGPGPRRTR